MNERIKEIAMTVQRDRHWNEEDIEKFAELIIKECARVAIQQQTENDIDGNVSKNPGKDFAYALIEHFGVDS